MTKTDGVQYYVQQYHSETSTNRMLCILSDCARLSFYLQVLSLLTILKMRHLCFTLRIRSMCHKNKNKNKNNNF